MESAGTWSAPRLSEFEYHKDDDLWLHPDGASVGYSDGERVERRLLRAIRGARDRSTFSPELQAQVSDWVSEYHFSQLRHNLLRHVSFGAGQRVLELGAGCGALTRLLGESGAEVTAIEGARPRARCAAARCADLGNVKVYCTPFHAAALDGPYDFVTLVGVLEYSPRFLPGEDPLRACLACLELARGALAADGQLLLAIENRNGLKYWAGMREDHCARRYAGLEDVYRGGEAVTLGRGELRRALASAGFAGVRFQYPFPDYKLPRALLDEAALRHPGFDPGELLARIASRDYCGPTEAAFGEGLAWPQLAANGLVEDLANSFLVLASPKQVPLPPDFLAVAYNVGNGRDCDRRRPYKVETRFTAKPDGGIEVRRRRMVAAETCDDASLAHVVQDEPYHRGPILASLLERDLARCDLDALAAHLKDWVRYVEDHGLAERRADRWQALIRPEYLDCTPENLVVEAGGLRYFDREWHYREPYTLAMLVVRGLWFFASSLSERLASPLGDSVLPRLCERVGLEGDLAALRAEVRRHERALYAVIFEPRPEPVAVPPDRPSPRRRARAVAGRLLGRLRRLGS